MKTKIYLLFITTLFFCAGCGNKSGGQKQESVSAAKDTYVNPLFPEGADPSALFHNGKYYYTHGTEDKIMLWETSDITDMAHAVCKIVWKPQDPSNSCHLWAPEIHYINDKWYIYYAADDGNTDNHQLYVLENSSPDPMEGKFEMKGSIITNPEWNWGIQATTFEHKGSPLSGLVRMAQKENQCRNSMYLYCQDERSVDTRFTPCPDIQTRV